MLTWTRHLFRGKHERDAAAAHDEPVLLVNVRADREPAPERLAGRPRQEPPNVGMVLCGRYRLEAVVGRGGSSVVYRATDLLLSSECAVKVLATSRRRAEGDGAEAEALAAMRLSHPNVARVYNYERHEPWQFLVMEYLAGVDLHQAAKQKPSRRMTLPDLLRIGVGCLDALAHAHEAGVLHNDVKPSNVILTRAGALKICDFGLARLTEDDTGSWLMAASAGSQAFISPERIKGEPCDQRSDLYSLAATLYALGAGHTLFGTEFAQAWRGHLELPPPPTRHIPAPLFRVLEVALRKEPDERFRSAGQMKQALLQAFRALRPQAPPPVAPARRAPAVLERPRRREAPAIPHALDDHEPAPPRATIRLVEPPGMIWIPGYRLASRHGGERDVDGFFLSRTPVTNGEYQRFLESSGREAPAHWIGGRPPPGRERHPVVGVTLADARAYAAFLGARLPSDLEWEAAARAPDRRAFPWGDAYEPHRVNSPDHRLLDTTPVDHHPEGATLQGLLDMVGNVWEWTDPAAAEVPEEGYAWAFGGSFRHPCVRGGGIPRTAIGVAKAYLYVGFRCAADARTAT